MICLYAESEAPDILFVESLVLSTEKVSRCTVLKEGDLFLVALLLKPVFTRSERLNAIEQIKTVLELYEFNALISIDLDVYNSVLKSKDGKAFPSEIIDRVRKRNGV